MKALTSRYHIMKRLLVASLFVAGGLVAQITPFPPGGGGGTTYTGTAPVVVTGSVISAPTTVTSAASLTSGAVMVGGGSQASSTPLSLTVTNPNSATETWSMRNTTATTGVTQLKITPGAGQGSTQGEFRGYEADGTTLWLSIRANDQRVMIGGDTSSGSGAFRGAVFESLVNVAQAEAVCCTNRAYIAGTAPAGIKMASTYGVSWSSLTPGSGDAFNSIDIGIDRDNSGVLGVINGTQGTTAANYRDLKLRHTLASGTAPVITSGFGTTPSLAGADGAGRLTVGTGGVATTGLITFGTAYTTAPSCVANNETSIALVQAVASTTTLTLNASAAFSAGALLTWHCTGY